MRFNKAPASPAKPFNVIIVVAAVLFLAAITFGVL